MDTILTCLHCGTKLKVKTAMLKVMKEVRCAKCRQPIPSPASPPEGGAPLPAQQDAPGPAAGAPPPAVAPVLVQDEADRVAAVEAQVRSLSEQVKRIQDDLARERSELADCAVEVENLRNRLSAVERKA
jgi:hypothetical protein